MNIQDIIISLIRCIQEPKYLNYNSRICRADDVLHRLKMCKYFFSLCVWNVTLEKVTSFPALGLVTQFPLGVYPILWEDRYNLIQVWPGWDMRQLWHHWITLRIKISVFTTGERLLDWRLKSPIYLLNRCTTGSSTNFPWSMCLRPDPERPPIRVGHGRKVSVHSLLTPWPLF